jgi:hypothetical protein
VSFYEVCAFVAFSPTPLTASPPPTAVPVAEAWRRLEALTAADARGAAAPLLATPAARAALRDSLLVAAAASHAPAAWVHDAEPLPEVLLGVLASDVRLALRALRDYTSTLGLEFVVPTPRGVDAGVALPAMRGPVYIKYNSRTRLCYAAPYAGRDRGVLAQLGGAQVGHLPLGLMDEARERPPPEI